MGCKDPSDKMKEKKALCLMYDNDLTTPFFYVVCFLLFLVAKMAINSQLMSGKEKMQY